MLSPVEDRAEALRRLRPEELGWLLSRVPQLADKLTGASPPVHYPTLPSMARTGLMRCAALLASPHIIDLTLATLNRLEHQLVMLTAWHGGILPREQALAETGREMAAALDAAAGALERLLLADRTKAWLRLRPGVAEVVGFPGVRVRDGLEDAGVDTLARILTHLGDKRPPRRKQDRLTALETRLRDRGTIDAVLTGAGKDAVRMFSLLSEHGMQRVRDLGIPYYAPWRPDNTPLHWLVERGLVGVDVNEQVAWVWLDVIIALNGRLFPNWPIPPQPQPQPLHDPSGGLPLVLSRIGALLDTWAAEPAAVLASGGLGVRPVRATAKALGLTAGEVGLLAHVAIMLGLLGRKVTATQGRGRNRTDTYGWAPTERAAEWRAAPPARRWALLVQIWVKETGIDEFNGLPERSDGTGFDPGLPHARRALLRMLAELPAGCGLAPADMGAQASFREPVLLPQPRVNGVVEAARVLGLVPPTGPIGLTRLGRALLDGPDAVEAAMPAPRKEFTVQADHTVIAPPDLAPDVITGLERYADVESAAGARIYRLSERRVAAALDDGQTAKQIIAFLDKHSTVPLAQNITHLIHDCQRRHGRLRVGAAGAYLRCDDPALLTRAVGLKAAKLRLLAPTVAVSELESDKLLGVLRGKGLMPVEEGPDGATLARRDQVAAVQSGGLPAVAPLGVLPDDAALEALAKSLIEDDKA
ncbi:MAG: helicase-associated domain-containing protein [Egibacteraceae bacterium]